MMKREKWLTTVNNFKFSIAVIVWRQFCSTRIMKNISRKFPKIVLGILKFNSGSNSSIK